MKKTLLSFVAIATLILAPAIYSVAGCDGTHIYACRSQLDSIQEDVNANCEVGETVYVHIVC